MTNLAQGVIGETRRTHGSQVNGVVDEAAVSGVYRRLTTSSVVGASHVLSKANYFRQLQLEKRRTDRSKAPLSMIVFHGGFASRNGMQNIRGLAEFLQASKRETDILGYMGENRLALLLPDTSKEGVQAVLRNVRSRSVDLVYEATAGTYPDQLFESLVDTHTAPTEAFPLLLDEPTSRSEVAMRVKRGVDIAGAALALLVLAPLMLVTAVAIASTSPGPVIFKQIRLGRRGAPFVFYKFRSMNVGVDDQIHREYVAGLIEGQHEGLNQGDQGKPHYKIKADPRVTRVGAFIRATSIDELPQLVNVLKGDMSLVGPRPPLPYEAEKYQSWHLRRVLEVRPGLTGLWQVEGRSRTSFDDMVRLDLRYIRNSSFLLDLKILIKTIFVVLRREGAT